MNRLFILNPQTTSDAMLLLYGNKITTQGQLERGKGKFKQTYGQLTDDDLAFSEGKEDELLGRLQQKLGRTKEDLRSELEKL